MKNTLSLILAIIMLFQFIPSEVLAAGNSVTIEVFYVYGANETRVTPITTQKVSTVTKSVPKTQDGKYILDRAELTVDGTGMSLMAKYN